MIAILHFATVVMATTFAAAAAVALHWLLLGAAFRLMRPATARRTRESRKAERRTAPTELVCGTTQVTRAFNIHL
jgi:hypothetical protein